MSEQTVSALPALDSPMMVDLFAGPGGLDVAAHWLGVPSVGIEFDVSAVDTRRAAGLSTIHADVTAWEPRDFTEAVNVLAGGPPCQTYTVAGNGHGRRALNHVIDLVQRLGEGRINEVLASVQGHSDPRTGLVLQPLIWALKAIEAERPFEAILLEQVPTVKPVWKAMQAVLEDLGYGVDVAVLRTEEYGVPQTRRRAILAARRGIESRDVSLPTATHQRYVGAAAVDLPHLDASDERPRWISMSEALGWGDSFTVVSNYGSGGNPRNRCRRRGNRPAFTVTGKVFRNRVIIDGTGEERRFGSAEAGRLQTFPSDYPWRSLDVAQQIGNAIPPRLGAHVLGWLLGIADRIDDQFFVDRSVGWVGPDGLTAERVRAAIDAPGIVFESNITVVGAPTRVAPSMDAPQDDGILGIVGRRPTVDAVESEPRHETRVATTV